MSLDTNFHLLIRDTWIPLPDVDSGVNKTLDRPRSSLTTLGNMVYEQLARKANAAWSVSYRNASSDSARWLQYAATGKAGEVWLYDVQAAQANMLDENSIQGVAAAATLVLVDGVPMPAFAATDVFTRKLRDGVAYHLSFTTTHTAGATIGTYDLGAGPVNIVAPVGTGPRRGSVALLPGDNVDLEVAWSVADVTSGARLSQDTGTPDDFLPGENTPCKVVVVDRSQTLDWAHDDQLSRGDTSFQIREVG